MADPTQHEEFIRQLSTSHNRLLAFITALMGDYEAAGDVLQETHVELWHRADDYEPGTNFFAWACAVARYKVLEARARGQRDRLIFDDDLVQVMATEAEAHPDVADDNRLVLDECLRELSEGQRDLIERRYSSGNAMKSLAAQTGRTAQSLGVTLFRIRRKLMDCVQRKQEAAS